ncbi:Peroxisomal adenine nucleotide transporter 1 [Golovinomyces cichoracearum]|uniref:Peroxisomal adenine nucleotide transporter 1 n=1 Tax=Golovinomyces cichoracearum TaxID=62708 RepID=A0A420HGX9_9PEZI|nr:Peroxisomal adenine nucleotide transporter 1 [Golovinomyces cichoracearum]
MNSSSKHDVIPPWGLAIAGATGAVIANAIVYPLDIVKTRIQVQIKKRPGDLAEDDPTYYKSISDAFQKIIHRDGISGLYTGINGSLLGVASTNFAYFYWYSILRTCYMKYHKSASTLGTAVELILGAVAGAAAQVFTTPVAVITTRQQIRIEKTRKSIVETAKDVIESDDGWTGLWSGLKASLILTVNPAITYGAYQRLGEIFFTEKANLRPREAFFLGAVSKSLATVVTQPLIVAKVCLQSKSLCQNQKQLKNFIDVMRYILKSEGITGLFKGIGPQIIKGLIVQGLLMMTKERVELLFILMFRYFRKINLLRLKNATVLTMK